MQAKQRMNRGPTGAHAWTMLAGLVLAMALAACGGGDPAAPACERNNTGTLILESKNGAAYDVVVDGRKLVTIPAGGASEKEVDAREHSVVFNYAGSNDVACAAKSVFLTACDTKTVSCAQQRQQQPQGGELIAENRSKATYKLYVDGQNQANLGPGQKHTVSVNAGNHDVKFKFSDNEHVACEMTRHVAEGGRTNVTCSVEAYYTHRINGAGATRLCPTHVGGDREFGGHGPDVWANANLAIESDGAWVSQKFYLRGLETRPDRTEAKKDWRFKLWTAPQGHKIVEILSSKHSDTYYRDTNHQLDYPPVNNGNLVARFEINGDTNGNDVGNCTLDDMYMNVFLNEVSLKVKR